MIRVEIVIVTLLAATLNAGRGNHEQAAVRAQKNIALLEIFNRLAETCINERGQEPLTQSDAFRILRAQGDPVTAIRQLNDIRQRLTALSRYYQHKLMEYRQGLSTIQQVVCSAENHQFDTELERLGACFRYVRLQHQAFLQIMRTKPTIIDLGHSIFQLLQQGLNESTSLRLGAHFLQMLHHDTGDTVIATELGQTVLCKLKQLWSQQPIVTEDDASTFGVFVLNILCTIVGEDYANDLWQCLSALLQHIQKTVPIPEIDTPHFQLYLREIINAMVQIPGAVPMDPESSCNTELGHFFLTIIQHRQSFIDAIRDDELIIATEATLYLVEKALDRPDTEIRSQLPVSIPCPTPLVSQPRTPDSSVLRSSYTRETLVLPPLTPSNSPHTFNCSPLSTPSPHSCQSSPSLASPSFSLPSPSPSTLSTSALTPRSSSLRTPRTIVPVELMEDDYHKQRAHSSPNAIPSSPSSSTTSDPFLPPLVSPLPIPKLPLRKLQPKRLSLASPHSSSSAECSLHTSSISPRSSYLTLLQGQPSPETFTTIKAYVGRVQSIKAMLQQIGTVPLPRQSSMQANLSGEQLAIIFNVGTARIYPSLDSFIRAVIRKFNQYGHMLYVTKMQPATLEEQRILESARQEHDWVAQHSLLRQYQITNGQCKQPSPRATKKEAENQNDNHENSSSPINGALSPITEQSEDT